MYEFLIRCGMIRFWGKRLNISLPFVHSGVYIRLPTLKCDYVNTAFTLMMHNAYFLTFVWLGYKYTSLAVQGRIKCWNFSSFIFDVKNFST